MIYNFCRAYYRNLLECDLITHNFVTDISPPFLGGLYLIFGTIRFRLWYILYLTSSLILYSTTHSHLLSYSLSHVTYWRTITMAPKKPVQQKVAGPLSIKTTDDGITKSTPKLRRGIVRWHPNGLLDVGRKGKYLKV
jgi:hypothetical protein